MQNRHHNNLGLYYKQRRDFLNDKHLRAKTHLGDEILMEALKGAAPPFFCRCSVVVVIARVIVRSRNKGRVDRKRRRCKNRCFARRSTSTPFYCVESRRNNTRRVPCYALHFYAVQTVFIIIIISVSFSQSNVLFGNRSSHEAHHFLCNRLPTTKKVLYNQCAVIGKLFELRTAHGAPSERPKANSMAVLFNLFGYPQRLFKLGLTFWQIIVAGDNVDLETATPNIGQPAAIEITSLEVVLIFQSFNQILDTILGVIIADRVMIGTHI